MSSLIERYNKYSVEWMQSNFVSLLIFILLMFVYMGMIHILDWVFSLGNDYAFPTINSLAFLLAIIAIFFIGTFISEKYNLAKNLFIKGSYVLFLGYMLTVALCYGHVNADGISYRTPDNLFVKKTIAWSDVDKNAVIYIHPGRKKKSDDFTYSFTLKAKNMEFDLFSNLTTFRKDKAAGLLKTLKDNEVKVAVSMGTGGKQKYKNSDDKTFIDVLLKETNSTI